MAQPVRLLLTGRPGCGKTTVILRTLERVRRPAAGFYTEEVRSGAARVGFDLITIDGRRLPLARAGRSGPRVGRYGVDVSTLDLLAVPALAVGLADATTLLVVDEIGKMEFLSRAFVALLPRLFRAPNPLLGAILAARHPIADRCRNASGVEVIGVDAGNRDVLPGLLAVRLQEFGRPGSPRTL